jgi:hypothetical protein
MPLPELSHEEKFLLDTMRSVAKILGGGINYREYRRRILYARLEVERGFIEEAEKEWGIIKEKFPQYWSYYQQDDFDACSLVCES